MYARERYIGREEGVRARREIGEGDRHDLSSIHGTGEVELRIKFTFKIIEMLEYERLFYNRFSCNHDYYRV